MVLVFNIFIAISHFSIAKFLFSFLCFWQLNVANGAGVGAVGGGIGTVVSGAGGAMTDGVGRMRRMSVSMTGGRLPFLSEIEESTPPTNQLETAEEEEEGSDTAGSRSPSPSPHSRSQSRTSSSPEPALEPEQEQSGDDDETEDEDKDRGALPCLAELKKSPTSSDRDSEELTLGGRPRTTSTMGRMRRASISEVFRGRALTDPFPSPRSSDGLSQDDNGHGNGELPPSLSPSIDEEEQQMESLVIHIVIREDNGHEVLHVLGNCTRTTRLVFCDCRNVL